MDNTTSLHTGSMRGPQAIRDSSEQFLPYHYDFDLDLGRAIGLVDCGDVAVAAGGRAARRPASPDA